MTTKPIGTVKAETPATKQKPTGYLWDRLAAANTREDVVALQAHATAHGYSPEGQIMTAIAEKLAAFDGTTTAEG